MTKEYRRDDEHGAPDSKGAVEEDNEKTTLIKGDEVLGYDGAGREEHSGQNSPTSDSGIADNEPEDVINDEK